MPAPRRNARRGFPVRQRSTTDWGRSVDTGLTLVGTGAKVLLATLSLNNPGIGEVVRRTRGRFVVASDQTAATETQFGAIGFIVVNDIAIALGVTGMPGPVTDANDDGWFVWEPFLQISEAGIGAADGAATVAPGFEYDSKAMRRIEEGFGIAVIAENSSSVHALNIAVSFSILTSRS